MNIDNLCFNQFTISAPFDISAKSWHGEQNCVQITNPLFESLKAQGLEFHYEVQIDEKSDIMQIRLDCHAFPYNEFSNNKGSDYILALKSFYSEKQANKIADFRDKLKNAYLSKAKSPEGYEYGKYNVKNSLWLVYKNYSIVKEEETLLAEIYLFIADTYPDFIATAKSINLL